jgi:hypothetical protein
VWDIAAADFLLTASPGSGKMKRSARRLVRRASPLSDESTVVLHGQLERALTGDAEARRRLLELTRDRLMRQCRRFLQGRYARPELFARTDDGVQQLFVKILQHQDRFWVNADGEPIHTLANSPRRCRCR